MARTYQHLLDTTAKPISTVVRDDGAFIPADAGNADWKDYQAWAAAGGVTVAAASVPKPVVIAPGALLARFTAGEQTALWTALPMRPALNGALLILLADGTADLTGAKVSTFMTQAVTALVITPARRTAILVP